MTTLQTNVDDPVNDISQASRGGGGDSRDGGDGQGNPKTIRIGIVGGGMAGLYAALKLKKYQEVLAKQDPPKLQIKFHMLELDNRTGGRVLSHYFTTGKNQYFEAGAMRVPNMATHLLVKDLIDYLNQIVPAEDAIKTMKYVFQDDGNRVFVNGVHTFVGAKEELTAEKLRFTDVTAPYNDKTADELLYKAVKKFLDIFDTSFEKGWEEIMKWDRVSFRYYLETEHKDPDNDNKPYPSSVVDFIEVMSSQANAYDVSFVEVILSSLDFRQNGWYTIVDGMNRLPECATKVIGLENITYGARVYKLKVLENEEIGVWAEGDRGTVYHKYDKVLLAIPPAALRMIRDRPQWSAKKEQSIRSLSIQPIYKIGLRFKSRFWERVARPCFGGQSITDQATRWIVYPSHGQKDEGPGCLLLYSWHSNASVWTSIPPSERVKHALRDIAQVYPKSECDIHSEFIEAESIPWPDRTPGGVAAFFPGQFTKYWTAASAPEGNIYFAGEHLSRHHAWIAGALDSAIVAVNQMIDPVASKLPLPFGVLGDPRLLNEVYDAGDYRKKVVKDCVPNLRPDDLKEHFGLIG